MSTVAAPAVQHLSLITGSDLVDRSGGRVGRVEDVIVRLGDAVYPTVSGLLASVAGRGVFVSATVIADIEHGRVTLSEARLDLKPFERRGQDHDREAMAALTAFADANDRLLVAAASGS